MPRHRLNLIPLDGFFAVAKLPPDSAIPSWASSGQFVSITRTAEELSVVCPDNLQRKSKSRWRRVAFAERMGGSLVGVGSA